MIRNCPSTPPAGPLIVVASGIPGSGVLSTGTPPVENHVFSLKASQVSPSAEIPLWGSIAVPWIVKIAGSVADGSAIGAPTVPPEPPPDGAAGGIGGTLGLNPDGLNPGTDYPAISTAHCSTVIVGDPTAWESVPFSTSALEVVVFTVATAGVPNTDESSRFTLCGTLATIPAT